MPRAGHDTTHGWNWNTPNGISTHVPRAGHDGAPVSGQVMLEISTHVPRAGHDNYGLDEIIPYRTFQPTCPVRGTTVGWRGRRSRRWHFNPRAPCGARHFPPLAMEDLWTFQPTCPVRGTTFPPGALPSSDVNFNPRAPCGARLPTGGSSGGETWISTHVPRAGHDLCYVPVDHFTDLISTHVPRAGHDVVLVNIITEVLKFQPTCPVRGTTRCRTRGDRTAADFNPRAPCGARPSAICGRYFS